MKQQDEQQQEIHRAVFSLPQGLLNPLGLKITQPIAVEVTTRERGQWIAREATSKIEYKLMGAIASAQGAKYQLATNFHEQLEPWTINFARNRQVCADHLHHAQDQPSLCGERFHQVEESRLSPAMRSAYPVRGRAFLVGDLRSTGRLPDAPLLCPVCWMMMHGAPLPGDRIRATANHARGRAPFHLNSFGRILTIEKSRYAVQWTDKTETINRGDFEPVFLVYSASVQEPERV